MGNDPVLDVSALGFPWPTLDPFLFCAYHDDHYPRGNEVFGPAASLAGRHLGMDFEGKDGWRMYHGEKVPGFPQHPHRGFETVTLVRRGFIDHSDSLGATARFGEGDVQWLTAGRGIVHCEMFPLLKQEANNPLELFQIWLNLPRADKMAEPHFSMLWSHTIARPRFVDGAGRATEVAVVAGALGDAKGRPPPPRSWASQAHSDVAIWTIRMEPGASWTVPPAQPTSQRRLYFFRGASLVAGGRKVGVSRAITVRADVPLPLVAGDEVCELLLLQGRPLDEPVAQYGPFVMNTAVEIQQAFHDYQRTRFGGWPFGSNEPVHPRDAGRFAKHADGRLERVGADEVKA